jgi:glycerol-3-phosphate dehydrogenase
LNIAQIGYGKWGQILAGAIDKYPNFNLTSIHTRNPITSQRYVPNLDSILNNPSIKAVVIAAPVEVRAELISKSLSANKHILTEKPLSHSSETSSQLLAKARKEDRILHVNYVHAASKTIKRIHELTSNEEIKAIRIGFGQPSPSTNSEGVSSLLFSHVLSILFRIFNVDSYSFTQSVAGNLTTNIQVAMNINDLCSCQLWADLCYPTRYRRIEVLTKSSTIYGDLLDNGLLEKAWIVNGEIQRLRQEIDQSNNLNHVFDEFLLRINKNESSQIDNVLLIDQILYKLIEET